MRFTSSLLICLLWILVGTVPAGAVEKFEFEFFYQVIEEVLPQITSVRDAAAAGGARAVVPALKNKVKQKLPWGSADTPLPLDVIRKKIDKRKTPMTAGKETITSDDKKTKYKVNRVKVTSEQQLLALMGVADGDESKLADGQKALLEMYRFSSNPTLISQMKKGFKEKITILVTDTNGNNSDQVKNDFWPCASGDRIQFSSTYFDRSDAKELARSVFIHEAAHTLDKTWQERDLPYGPDNTHYANEMTKPKAAFMEGWAEFAQMFYSKEEEERIREAVKNIKIEGTQAGVYSEVKAEELSGTQLLNVEGINALIFLDLARLLPNGAEVIFNAFIATNQQDRSLETVLKHLVAKFPAQAEEISRIVDRNTLGRLTSAEMLKFLGSGAGVKAFLSKREEARLAAQAAAAASAAAALAAQTTNPENEVTAPVEPEGAVTPVTMQGGNPYEDY